MARQSNVQRGLKVILGDGRVVFATNYRLRLLPFLLNSLELYSSDLTLASAFDLSPIVMRTRASEVGFLLMGALRRLPRRRPA